MYSPQCDMQPELLQIQNAVEQRVTATLEVVPGWPCRKGCDQCCRSLAAQPRITAAEWELMRSAVLALPREKLTRVRTLTDHRPIVCPLLDEQTGACAIYEVRPVACRTFGFYRERDRGLYCRIIEEQVNSGGLDDVVWGNQESVEAALTRLGESRRLGDWLDK